MKIFEHSYNSITKNILNNFISNKYNKYKDDILPQYYEKISNKNEKIFTENLYLNKKIENERQKKEKEIQNKEKELFGRSETKSPENLTNVPPVKVVSMTEFECPRCASVNPVSPEEQDNDFFKCKICGNIVKNIWKE